MHYVYVLKSRVDGQNYVGYTSDLKRRINEHNQGMVASTERRCPLDLIYYEACRNMHDATKREKYLKTSYGRRYIRNRLAHDLDENEYSTG
mgnify:CR=1 FL=1